MRQFLGRVHHFCMEASKWLNRATAALILVAVAACAAMPQGSDRTVFVEYSETNAVEREYARILSDAGYRLVGSREGADYTARFYHEERTNYCDGNRRVFIRARMVIESRTNSLDMSSTERCAYDNLAAHLLIREALEYDRNTYLRRLRSF